MIRVLKNASMLGCRGDKSLNLHVQWFSVGYCLCMLMQLLSRYHTAIFALLDVDECLEDNGGCDHFCINTQGSYKCECKQLFILANDKRKCLGKHL